MLPEKFLARMQQQLGDEYDEYLRSLQRPRAVALRFNPLKGAIPALPFVGEPVPWEPMGYYYDPDSRPGLHPYHEAGVYYLQEASAMASAALLEPQPGEIILDLCAAPGGKSTQIAGRMQGQGLLVSNEIHPKRAKVLSRNIERLGIGNAVVTGEAPAALADRFPGFFHRIMVDAPCSGEGMFRKDEGAIGEWSTQNVNNCWQLQREIVSDIWNCLKPGGILIYSTCTFNAHEDEENVDWICEELGAEVMALEGVEDAWNITRNLTGTDFPVYRFIPGVSRGEGLFMAILKKEGEWEAGSSVKENRKDKKKKDKKVAKGKGPEIPDDWLKTDTEWMPAESNETVYAIPGRWKDIYDQAEKNLKVLHAGVKLGTDKGKGLIPDQALALSTMLNKDHFPQVELSYEDAIRYLRKEAVNLPADTPKGYVLVTYRQVPIGWEKNIGNRANNLYPQEWKIKSSHGTGELFIVNSL